MTPKHSKHTRTLASVIAAGAVLAVPAAALAKKGDDHARDHNRSHENAAHCAKTHNVGFAVNGTLLAFTADDAATPANEATVTLTITSANRHARNSGDIDDQNVSKPGVQARGAIFTVPATDAFKLRLHGYQGADTPSVGDKVKVRGRIARTPRKCAPAGTSIADRLGAPDVRRVTISDRDAD